MGSGDRLSVLHLAPHPDDELIGAPATLMGLRDAGHRVFNLACSLGSEDQRERRRDELAEAMHRAGFAWAEVDPPVGISSHDDLDKAEANLMEAIRTRIAVDDYDLVISPSPQDAHHGHEVVGRATAAALGSLGSDGPRWWMWGLWADLPLPTLFVPFGGERLQEILYALSAHRGELKRSDYAAVVEGRSRASRVLGVERVFGFGEPKPNGDFAYLIQDHRRYAELLTEVTRWNDDWWTGVARVPDFGAPLAPTPEEEGRGRRVSVGWWLSEPSVQARFKRAPVH
jgi:LmbE family N-acetylglucosaminyl deacetylase